MTLNSRTFQELKNEIRADEGCVNEVYRCTAGKLTFGIGHMIKPDDVEYGLEEGTVISDDRVERVFDEDVTTALGDCWIAFEDFASLPPEVQKIMANMMFQLGLGRFMQFKRMMKAVEYHDWLWAADEMRDSLWNKQTHNRSERLIARMRMIGQQ